MNTTATLQNLPGLRFYSENYKWHSYFCKMNYVPHHNALILTLTQYKSKTNLFPVVSSSFWFMQGSPSFVSWPTELPTSSSSFLLINADFDSLMLQWSILVCCPSGVVVLPFLTSRSESHSKALYGLLHERREVLPLWKMRYFYFYNFWKWISRCWAPYHTWSNPTYTLGIVAKVVLFMP